MCGIYGLLSARNIEPAPGDGFFQQLQTLLEETKPRSFVSALGEQDAARGILERLHETSASAGRWVSRGGFLAVLTDPSLAERLRGAVGRIRDWIEQLESLDNRGRAVVQSAP